jgi:hypothetical protein
MSNKSQTCEEKTINVTVFFASGTAFGILLVLLVFFFINQATLIGKFKEAVGLYKDVLSPQSVNGADITVIPTDEILLWNEKIKYLEQLNVMHKQVSTTDLFVLIYGFLSSVLIGISGYLVKKSECQLKNASDKYVKLKRNTDELIHKISDKYIKLEENANELEQKISNSDKLFLVSQILSDAITDISTYKHTPEIEYLVRFRQEVTQIVNCINDIKLDEIDRSIILRIEQRFGTIRGLYEETSKDPKKISGVHKSSVQEDFKKIKLKLADIQGKN